MEDSISKFTQKEFYETAYVKGTALTHTVHFMHPAHSFIIDLERSRAIKDYSDTFQWGYTGAGALQLSLAIMIELFGVVLAMRLHEDFTKDVIANLPMGKDFEIQAQKIIDYMLDRT